MDQVIHQKVVELASKVEQKLDSEIEKFDNLTLDDFEKLREQRLKEMKKLQQQKKIYLLQGHGEYTEIANEKEFFDICKVSNKIICHFYKTDSERCKLVDMHLKILCKKHLESRFIKLNVENCPFLIGRLRIKIIPTICLIVDSKTKDYIIGFTDLGNCDDFSTEMLEWRIAKSGAIQYNGDLINPPDNAKKLKTQKVRSIIRGKTSDDSDSD